MTTTSHVIKYIKGHKDTDRLGGLPTHLPHRWPQCQSCQTDLAFVGQVYSSEKCQFGDYLCLHFYMCVIDCTGEGDLLLHMEPIPKDAVENESKFGTAHPDQSKTTLRYTAKVDPDVPIEELTAENAPHIFKDKVGGLFPYEGDGLDVNENNVCYLQMFWPAVGVQMFVCQSKERGIYLKTYS